MMTTPHLGDRPHPVVASVAREHLNKSENERSGVLSTAMSFLGLYSDPVVAKVTRRCDWGIAGLAEDRRPATLYFVVPPSDISWTKPLVRLILNQIGLRQMEELDAKARRHRVLLMLDEFPAVGRLQPDLMRALAEYAERRGKLKSLVAETAIASFLSPDAAERQEATLARRLDRITRQMEPLERDVGISADSLALFIRFWPMATPSLPEHAQAVARAKGAERYDGFVQAPGRRLAKGQGFIKEVSLDIRTTRHSSSKSVEKAVHNPK